MGSDGPNAELGCCCCLCVLVVIGLFAGPPAVDNSNVALWDTAQTKSWIDANIPELAFEKIFYEMTGQVRESCLPRARAAAQIA